MVTLFLRVGPLSLRTTISILVSLVGLCSFAAAADSLADLPKKAAERSQITVAGSRPFILRAKVLETTNPTNDEYKAEIEEYWAAPDKWRRTVKTPNFSETLIVNGEKRSEQLTGDYYPNWLRDIVAAIFDPGSPLQGLDMTRSYDNPRPAGPGVCRRFKYLAGLRPVGNKISASFCFANGLIESVVMPGYRAAYKNYRDFTGKQVARTITEEIEPRTEIEATVEELNELSSVDESLFATSQTNERLRTVQLHEETLRHLAVNAPDIVWPKVRDGAETGTLTLYVCLDRSGRVREIYELNSSNPSLSDFARDQVMKWQFKPALNQGVPVQVESMLTFAFQTTLVDPTEMLAGSKR